MFWSKPIRREQLPAETRVAVYVEFIKEELSPRYAEFIGNEIQKAYLESYHDFGQNLCSIATSRMRTPGSKIRTLKIRTPAS